jgi:hypothetical protein
MGSTLAPLHLLVLFVSTTIDGSTHNHVAICPKSGFSRPGSDNRVHHMATPINPIRTGKMINIGGEDETKYLGFVDFSTKDTATGGAPVGSPANRPFTEGLPARCASDICLRNAPITAEIRKEISRLARPGCRLTAAQSRPEDVNSNRDFLTSVGVVIEDVFIVNETDPNGQDFQVFVVSMRGDGRYVETSNDRTFSPGRVVRNGRNAQVFES